VTALWHENRSVRVPLRTEPPFNESANSCSHDSFICLLPLFRKLSPEPKNHWRVGRGNFTPSPSQNGA
jgi:hypothetical protein